MKYVMAAFGAALLVIAALMRSEAVRARLIMGRVDKKWERMNR